MAPVSLGLDERVRPRRGAVLAPLAIGALRFLSLRDVECLAVELLRSLRRRENARDVADDQKM